MRKTAPLRSVREPEGEHMAYEEVERRMHHARQLRAEHLGATIANLLAVVHSAALQANVHTRTMSSETKLQHHS